MKEIIINWNEYQQGALSTAIYPLKRELEYTVLGLCSEVGELGEAYAAGKQGWGYTQSQIDNFKSELGDVYWYVAAVADALKVPLAEIAKIHPLHDGKAEGRGLTILDVVASAAGIAGIVKKAIRDNNGFLDYDKQADIEALLCRILSGLGQLARSYGSTPEAVTAKNLNKLADRKQRGVLQGSGDNR